ncbi:10226_t:CDS:1, partial [Entrophospora sp. SA101]
MKDFAALPKDGLNAAHMNAKPGGEQPCTHSTFYGPNNTPQEM